MKKQIIAYLACPYSHPDPEMRELRYRLVNRIALKFHQRGKFIYSPLSHNVTLMQLNEEEAQTDWENFNKSMLERCDELIVLKVPGWEESKGVTEAIALAKDLGMPIEMINPKGYFELSLVGV